MKRLTLLRHGRAADSDALCPDIERPLQRRGVSEVAEMARRLFELGLVPDLVLTSPAQRTHETALIVIRELDLPNRALLLDHRIYQGRGDDLLTVIECTATRIEHLLLVGHNPALSELARRLAGDPALMEFTPATRCSMQLPISAWSEVATVVGNGLQFDLPRSFINTQAH